MTGKQRICFNAISLIATWRSSSGEQHTMFLVMTSLAVIFVTSRPFATARQVMSRSVTIPTNWPSSWMRIASRSASRMHFAITLMDAFESRQSYALMHRIFDFHFRQLLSISRKFSCPGRCLIDFNQRSKAGLWINLKANECPLSAANECPFRLLNQ